MQKRMRDAGGKLPGLVYARQLRARDANAALAVVRFTDRAAWEAFVDSAAYVEASKLPEGVKHVRTETFEIVSNVLPKSA
jgi:hypothetical protein